MAIGPTEVRRLLRLAHLELPKVADREGRLVEPEDHLVSDAELATLAQELDQILARVEELKSVDVEGIEPTSHAIALPSRTRPDEIGAVLGPERVLAAAPARVGDAFVVPKIVE
jgi:aspartyl-tRNA(Asn)/glutamyl-tRNA(Gln) amidotransferase subunit C